MNFYGSGHHEPLGDVDIYLNGGEIQPGCSELNRDFGVCSHEYAVIFFKHAQNNEVKGFPCASIEALRSGKCEEDTEKLEMMFGPNQLKP